ncbi:UPF0104 family protein [Acetobacteraceae bacterium]|nr:UPF0104 family protein [Acetobacteraceae bacterium]
MIQKVNNKKEKGVNFFLKRKNLGAFALRALPFLVAAILVVVGGLALFREASHFSIHEVKQAVTSLPASSLLKAASATILAYFLLSFYDYFGAWYAQDPQPWFKSALAAFCSYVFAHNLGFTALSGAAVRYRLYRVWGMSTADIARVVIFCTWACSLGIFFLVGIALLSQPNAVPITWVKAWITIPLGIICLLVVLLYLLLSLRGGKVKIKNWELVMPTPALALGQLLTSALDMGVTALILWCVLGEMHISTFPPLTFFGFIGIYLTAYMAGLLSSVPGGVGVFDAFLLTMLLPWFNTPQIVGALVVFRAFYYLIPLLLAGVLFSGHEFFLRISKKKETFLSKDGIHFAEGDFTTQIGSFLELIFALCLSTYALLGLPFGNTLSLRGILLFFLGALIAGLSFALGQKVFAAWRASVIVLTTLLPILLFLKVDRFLFFFNLLALFIILPFRRYYYRQAHIVAFPNVPRTLATFLLILGIFFATVWAALGRRSGEVLWISKETISFALAASALLCLFAIFFSFRRTRVHLFEWKDSEVAHFYAVQSFIPEGYLVEASGNAWGPCLRLNLKWDEHTLLMLGGPYGDEKYFSAVIWRMRDFAVQDGRNLAWLIEKNNKGQVDEKILKKLGLEAVSEDNWVLYASPSQISTLLHFFNNRGYD